MSLIYCDLQEAYDFLQELTNSIIHPNQRRASYRELVQAYMKGFIEYEKRLEEGVEK